MKNIIALAFSLIFVCSLNAQTTLKRYKCLSRGWIDNGLVTITVSSSTVSSTTEPPKFKTIFDLNDRGQFATLTNKTNEQISELLNKKFLLKEPEEKSIVDLTTKNIRITLSISRRPEYSKKMFSAYDRIEDLNYSFKMDDKNIDKRVKFVKWNKYTTEYGTLNIGTLEYSQSFSADLDITGKIGASTDANSAELSTTAKTGYEKFRKENQTIKQTYIQLTGSFGERNFNIHQQGTRETEIAGNVSIDLDIELPFYEVPITTFSNLHNDSSLPSTPDKVKINHLRYRYPDTTILSNGIQDTLKFNYVVRHIRNKKSNTYPEFDDKINFITGKNSILVTLIKKEDLIIPIYFIVFNSCDSAKALQYTREDKLPRTILFSTYEDAAEFRNWLISAITTLNDKELLINSEKISFQDQSVMDDKFKNNLKGIKINLYKGEKKN